MPSVFLSHSGKDKEFVRELAASVQQGDGEIQVWLDESQIEPSDRFTTIRQNHRVLGTSDA